MNLMLPAEQGKQLCWFGDLFQKYNDIPAVYPASLRTRTWLSKCARSHRQTKSSLCTAPLGLHGGLLERDEGARQMSALWSHKDQ